MGSSPGLTVKQAKEILKKHPVVIPDAFSDIRKELEGFKVAAKQLETNLNKQFEGIERALREIQNGFKRYAEQLTPSLRILADHGWYICGNSAMTDSIDLSIEIKKGNTREVDMFMVDFYEKEFEYIINNLKKSYPGRSKIITEAKNAHNRGMYYSSTSLFLSTADGIFNGHLFKDSKKGKPNLKKELDCKKQMKEYVDLLIEMSPLDAVYGKANLFKSTLNRHKVMHGIDVEYGTRENSLKALSLLAFICDFFGQNRLNKK